MHYTQWTYANISSVVGMNANNFLKHLADVEDLYQRLFNVYQTVGATDTAFAEILFDIVAPDVPTAEQIQQVTDLRLAISAMHDVYEVVMGISAKALENRANHLRKLAEPQIVALRR